MKPISSCIVASLLFAFSFELSFAQQEGSLETIAPARPLIPAGDDLANVDCEAVATEVYQRLTANKNLVLEVVEDAINRYSSCAPLVVATAIEATGATTDSSLLKQIVMLGVQLAEDQATDIAQEAVLVAPDSADTVRAAFTEAFDVMAATKEKPPVKEGPKSEWEVRTNTVETEMPTPEEETMVITEPEAAPAADLTVTMDAEVSDAPGDEFTVPLPEPTPKMESSLEVEAEPTIAFVDEEPSADLTLTVEPDFPKEAVLPEPKPLNPSVEPEVAADTTPTVDTMEEAAVEEKMVVGIHAEEAVAWAGEKSAESPIAEGSAVESAPRESTNTLENSEKSFSQTTVRSQEAREPSNPYEAENYETPWQRDVSTTHVPVNMASDYRVGLRETFGHERHRQVGGVSYVQPTRSAIRKVNQTPRSAVKRVIPFSENRKRRSFAASAIVRGVPMSPTNP